MMKKNTIFLLLCLISLNAISQDMNEKFSIPIGNMNLKFLGLKNFYPTYLADPLGIRFEVTSEHITYGDIDFQDKINSNGDYTGKLTINPGVRVSLLKFTSKDNPKLGVEVDLGATIPTIMRAGNHDVIAADGIYYFAIAGRPTEWLALRFSKHHICTHLGDEYPSGSVNTPIDYDPNTTQLPVRDDFVFSVAAKPLYFLGKKEWNILQIYTDIGFFYPGSDFMGGRQNKPSSHAYFHFQGGMELEYYLPWTYLGGIYAAGNVSAYQSNAYAPNISLVAGYIIPQDRNKRKIRIGVNYYNGRCLSNHFPNRKEKYIAFICAMDI